MGIFGESLPLFGTVNLDFEFHSVSNSIIYGNGRFACIARVHRQRARPSFALMVSSVIVIKRRTVFKPGPGLTAHRLCFPAVIPVPPMRPAAALDALRRLRPGTVAGFRAPMAGPIDTGPPTCPATTACPPRSLPLAPGRHDLSRGVGQSSRPGKHRIQGLIRWSRTSQFSPRLAKYACSASQALWNCADYHRASRPRRPPASQRC